MIVLSIIAIAAISLVLMAFEREKIDNPIGRFFENFATICLVLLALAIVGFAFLFAVSA